jgi:hypothetical protein
LAVIICLPVGFCQQDGELPELAQRAIAGLAVVPSPCLAPSALLQAASPSTRWAGTKGFVDLEPLVSVDVGKGKREMR